MKTLPTLLFTLLLLAGPSFGQAAAGNDVEALTKRVAQLEKKVAQLEKLIVAMTSKTPATTNPKVAGKTTAAAGKAPLILDKWEFSVGKDNLDGDAYRIKLTLRNAGTKGIKLIKASVHFTDLLDDELYGIKISPDLKIGAGKTLIKSGLYGINQFIARQGRMKKMAKADIKAKLVIQQIVFDDNTVMKITK